MINIFDADGRLNDQVPDAYARHWIRSRLPATIGARRSRSARCSVGQDRGQGPIRCRMEIGSGVVIEPWLTDQWYVNAEDLWHAPAIEAVEVRPDPIRIPENWSKTFFEWMRNIQPWCISRQLWWGHRIPAWYGADGSKSLSPKAKRRRRWQKRVIHYGTKEPR